MTEFAYTAKAQNGRTVEAVRAAESEMGLVSLLRKEGLTVISVAPVGRTGKRASTRRGKRVKVKDLAILCRQLSAMLDAGLPVLESLEAIADQIDNPTLAEVLKQVAGDIEAGSTLSQAIEKHEKIFSILFVAMLKSGEEAGALPTILGRLGDYLEARDALARKIRAASTYPAFIAGFFVVAVAGIMLFLIPQFESIFADFDLELPMLTQFLITLSRFIGRNLIWEVLMMAGAVYAFWRWHRTPSGKRRTDSIILQAPIFGKLVLKASVARFSRTLGTLMDNGVSVVAALEIVGRTSGNTIVKEAIDRVSDGVVNGSTISEKMSESSIFPKMVVSMVAAGEGAGNLPDMLEKVSDFYTKEVDAAVSALTSMIEPALIVGLGAIVTVVVLAIYLPIFQMATGID
jgi:type IV pilus assembly protein PilC